MEKELKFKVEVTEDNTAVDMQGGSIDLGNAMCNAVRGVFHAADKLRVSDEDVRKSIKMAILNAAVNESGIDLDEFLEAKEKLDNQIKEANNSDTSEKLDDIKSEIKNLLKDLLG